MYPQGAPTFLMLTVARMATVSEIDCSSDSPGTPKMVARSRSRFATWSSGCLVVYPEGGLRP